VVKLILKLVLVIHNNTTVLILWPRKRFTSNNMQHNTHQHDEKVSLLAVSILSVTGKHERVNITCYHLPAAKSDRMLKIQAPDWNLHTHKIWQYCNDLLHLMTAQIKWQRLFLQY